MIQSPLLRILVSLLFCDAAVSIAIVDARAVASFFQTACCIYGSLPSHTHNSVIASGIALRFEAKDRGS